MKFEYITRYFGTLKNEATVWVSTTYEEGLPSTVTDWKQVKTYPLVDASSWNYFSNSYELDLSEFAGKKISVAFKYVSTNTKAGTWELKNFSIQEGAPSDVCLFEGFDASLGNFSVLNVLGDQVWHYDTSYGAYMSGFVKPTTYANEDWLVSPTVDLSGIANAYLTFDHAARFFNNASTDISVWISENYEQGMPSTATWTQLPTSFVNASSWTFVSAGKFSLANYSNKKIRIALKYVSTSTTAGTWEVKNFMVYK